jgi:hypothetical protein
MADKKSIAESELLSLAAGKLRAGLIHLGVSIVVLLPLLALILFAWFPPPLFRVQGASGVVGILVMVQLVVFPVLTFIVFDPAKKGLRFDLAVIVLLQAAALAYGGWSIHSERPRYLVYAVDSYEVLAEKDVDFAAAGMSGFGERPFAGPVYVFAEMPVGAAFREFQQSTWFGGEPDLERRPEFWRPLEGTEAAILSAARPLEQLASARPDSADALRHKARSLGLEPERARVVPLIGKRRDFTAFLDPVSARILAIAETDPWLAK